MHVTLENPAIRSFFDKESEEAPVEELRYILDKKVSVSFLAEISSIVQAATQKALRKKIKVFGTYSVADSYNAFLLLAASGVMEDNNEKISEALKHLREIYTTATRILES